MAAYSCINQTFLLPKDFDVTGTDIKRCLDSEIGYLNPREDVSYTFLIQVCMAYAIRTTTAKEMESKLESNSAHAYTKICFVCPTIDEPDHDIAKDKVSVYIDGMVEAWNKCRSAIPSTVPSKPKVDKVRKSIYFEDIEAIPHPIDEGFYVLNDSRFRGVVINKSKKVVGYNNRDSKIPHRIFKELCINYSFEYNYSAIEQVSPLTCNHGFQKITHKKSIITAGLMEGIVFKLVRNPDGLMTDVILGYGPKCEPIERDLAAEIIAQYVVIGAFYLSSSAVKKPTRPIRYGPIEGKNNVVVIEGPLRGLSLIPGKKFFYVPREEHISQDQCDYIEKYHPNIIVPY